MNTTKQLYMLQELDLILDRLQGEKVKVEQELASGPPFGQVDTAHQAETEHLTQMQSQHRLQQLELETLRERSTHLENQLYGGEVTNPRDLESAGQEVIHVKQLLEQQDAALLELSVQAEESQSRLNSLEEQLSNGHAEWQVREAELQEQVERWNLEAEEVSTRRKDLAAGLDASTVQRYDGLRRTKRGLAVAKVERGLCQACRMALPTQQQQLVRIGLHTVLCSSCGRMLIPA